MKTFIFFIWTILGNAFLHPAIAQGDTGNFKVLIGVFDGRTPCKYFANLLQEKVSTDCIKIKWRLKLYSEPSATNGGSYELVGFARQRSDPRKGKWRIVKGSATNPGAIIYALESGREPTIYLQKLDDNIFYFLDKDRNMLIGNEDFSYTLNRMNKSD